MDLWLGLYATDLNQYGNHVTAGNKETCNGDFGGPLLCDIGGKNTLVGINSRGYEECGTEGYPAIHISTNVVYDWLKETITQETAMIWTNWSRCTEDCMQTRTRAKHEQESRKCVGVCFRDASDVMDSSLKLCELESQGLNHMRHVICYV